MLITLVPAPPSGPVREHAMYSGTNIGYLEAGISTVTIGCWVGFISVGFLKVSCLKKVTQVLQVPRSPYKNS